MFTDKKKRTFVLYKGWCIDNFGEPVRDPLMELKRPTLRVDYDNYPYNLIDKNGHKVLSKSVPIFDYVVSDDIYIISDFFKDEQSDKNKKLSNVVTKEGKLLTAEWFDNIIPSNCGYLRIERRGKYNLLDQHGHFLLKNDAEFVSDYLGNYAYCCHDGILSIVFPDGREEIVRALDVYDESRDGKIKSTWRITYIKAICRKTEGEKEEWNYLVNYKNVLFKHYYDKLNASGIQGLYFVWENGETKLIDMAENVLTDFSFKLPHSSYFIFGHAITEIEGKYGLINYLGKIVARGYSSVLWAPQGGKLWMMILFRNSTEKHYYHGQGGSYIHYAHEFLINNRIVCLLEKDNIWYYPDYDNNLVELFYCEPESIETGSDF